MADGIVFDAEGGFSVRRPNGTVLRVPAEQVKKIIHLFTEVARWHDSWGIPLPQNATRDDVIHHFGQAANWTFIDQGNLARIAVACEQTLRAAREQAAETRKLAKELKEMTAFWKELRKEYRKNHAPVDEDV